MLFFPIPLFFMGFLLLFCACVRAVGFFVKTKQEYCKTNLVTRRGLLHC